MSNGRFKRETVVIPDVFPDKRQYQLLYFVLFASGNGIFAFRNVYFEEIGLSGFQMGIVGAVIVASGMLAQPVWGLAADRYGRTKLAMGVGALVSGGASLLYPLGQSAATPFLVVLVASVLFSAFQAPIGPLANSMVLSAGIDYGQVRAFGSVAFGIGILVVGWAIEQVGTPLIFYAYVIGMGAFVVTLYGLPRPDADVAPAIGRESVSLLTNRRYLLLLVVTMLIGGTTATGGAFFSVYMRAIDAGDSMTGAAWLVRTLAEAAVFLGVTSVSLDSRSQLTLSTIAYALTFVTYGFTGALAVVFGIQLLHGLAIALFGLASVQMAHRLAPDSLSSTSQAMMGALGLGVGNIVGQLVGGRLIDAVGVQDLYFYLTAGLAIAFMVSLGFFVPTDDRVR